MALEKNSIPISFSQGVDTLSDPNQLPIGKFVSLTNTTFIKKDTGEVAALKTRNGFGAIGSSNSGFIQWTPQSITTFQNNLVGFGSSFNSLIGAEDTNKTIVTRGYSNSWSGTNGSLYDNNYFIPVKVETTSLLRNSSSQTFCDIATAPNGLSCIVTNGVLTGNQLTPGGLWQYKVIDSETGQTIGQNFITSSGGSQLWPPAVFTLGSQFVIVNDVYNSRITSASVSFLQLTTFPWGSESAFSTASVTTISSNCALTTPASFDGTVASNSLFLSWHSAEGTGALRTTKLDAHVQRSALVNLIPNYAPDLISVCADLTTDNKGVYTASCAGSASSVAFSKTDFNLNIDFFGQNVPGPAHSLVNLVSIAKNGQCAAYGEIADNYIQNSQKINNVYVYTANSGGGVALRASVFAKSVGLASRPFSANSTTFLLGTYSSAYQSTYFLFSDIGQGTGLFDSAYNGTFPVAKLAYGNGGGYYEVSTAPKAARIPSVAQIGSSFCIPYLIADSISSVNKGTNVPPGTPTVGIYSNLGVNLSRFTFGYQNMTPKEIGNNLNLNGGFLWSYDGLNCTENNFHIYPDYVYPIGSGSAGAGSIVTDPNVLGHAATYYYQAVYEYTDNQGMIHRSAPSVPVSLTINSGTSRAEVRVQTCVLTAKPILSNPLSIGLYRWSTSQQNYFKTTSQAQFEFIASNSTVLMVDNLSDADILGNEALYTTGGILENSGSPSSNCLAMFDSRLWLIDSEDGNLLWYSKIVVEGVPVEMSDLQTLYAAPVSGTQVPVGKLTAIAPMDDKLIIFRRNSIYYINGRGPDATGANDQYSDPIFINGSVGCIDPRSLLLIPNGLMFQSDNGIWMVGRDLSVTYIGKDVEIYNDSNVVSALVAPGTSEARFSLSTGEVLVFDYLLNQWSTNTGVPALCSTVYQNLHTYVDSRGAVYQETPGLYSDGGTATTMGFTTGFISPAGTQGWSRVYRMYMLAKYFNAHQIQMGIAYDYDPTIKQSLTFTPTNTTGSGTSVEQWQIGFTNQSCQSFQLTLNEIASGSAGAGLYISNLNILFGARKRYPVSIPVNNKTS